MTWTPFLAAVVGTLIGTALAWGASRVWPSLGSRFRFFAASYLIGLPFAYSYLALARVWWPDEPASRFFDAMRWLA